MLRVVVVPLVAALLGSAPASAGASQDTGGLNVTINGGAPTLITPLEIQQDADIPAGGCCGGQGGVTTDLVAELLGVAPQTLDPTNAMLIAGGPTISYGPFSTLTRDEVISGFGSPPTLGFFSVSGISSDTDTNYYGPSGFQIQSGDGSDLAVDLTVAGTVLGVPGPTATIGTATLGQPVQFGVDPSRVTLGTSAGSPVDSNGLSYSWNFGDGTPPTRSNSTTASHAYAAAGTYDVRVTVTDAAENAGVSPQAAVVQVPKDDQSISFPQLGPYTFGVPAVALGATASSGLPVTYTVVSGPCIVSGTNLTFTGPGSCVVGADQPGNAPTYNAAARVTSTIVIAPTPTPPVCSDQAVNVPNATAATVTLGCADAAGDPGDALGFAVVTQPAHGTLSGLDGSTGAVTYTPTGTYAGPDSFTFDATDAQGTATASTVTITVVPQAPPTSAAPPALSGAPQTGATLSCSTGVWSGGVPQTYSYQWLRDGGPIVGAVAPEYVVQSVDQGHALACLVTATNAGGSAGVTSPGVAIPAPSPAAGAPANVGLPGVSGTAAFAHKLSCSTGSWSGSQPLTYSYQWIRNGSPIAGAVLANYAAGAGDAGHKLNCVVTATNAAGRASASSSAVAIAFASNAFTRSAPKAAKSGSITIRLHAPGPGGFSGAATFAAPTTKARAGHPVTYGRAAATAHRAGTVTLTIRPGRTATALLRARGRLRVTVSVTFTPTGGRARLETAMLTVRHP
jgi:hypothetical protein